ADGVDLRQLSSAWWRSQLAYMPQDVQFLPASIRENLLAAVSYFDEKRASVNFNAEKASVDKVSDNKIDNSNLSESEQHTVVNLNKIIKDAGLINFIDQSQQGLDTQIINNGANLSTGHRKRLALARALAVGGKLLLFDEPTEGLDRQGCNSVYSLLVELSKKGHTMIIFTQDPNIIRGATRILDLNSKPVPKIVISDPKTLESKSNG
ncbi:MAG: ATP-binding cassette domain-containing protein, partial [Desulfamplus sp.]